MLAASSGSLPHVRDSGGCMRKVKIGDADRIVQPTWRPHTTGVQLTTTLLRTHNKTRGREVVRVIANDVTVVGQAVAEDAESAVAEARRRYHQRHPESARIGGRQRSREVDACPIVLALRGAETKTRRIRLPAAQDTATEPAVEPEREEEHTLSCYRALPVTQQEHVLNTLIAGSTIAGKMQEDAVDAAVLRRVIRDAGHQRRKEDGPKTFRAVLTAAAGQGASPVPVTAKRRVEILRVDAKRLRAARERAKRLRPDLEPSVAIKENAYWYQERARRYDARSPERLWLTEG